MAIIHQINPVALDIGFFQIYWYGVSYLMAFACAYTLALYRKRLFGFNEDMVYTIILYGMFGVILGGRIGSVLLYNFGDFIANPMSVFYIRQGGMSFHGGLLGVIIALCLVAKKYKLSPFAILDFIAPCVPIGLFFGRLGNFAGGELWGRVSDGGYSWLMYFPNAVRSDYELLTHNPLLATLSQTVNGYSLLPRHPSQIYQALTEGLLLFIILWLFALKPRPRYAVSALFLIGYGIFRFFIEFFRQPDTGYELIFGWMSKGQLFNLPMIIAGIILLIFAYKKQIYDAKLV